ncbi:MAG: Ni/Fe hydrogenase subunit alpha [Candidatus Natronoplasma sp.]
MSEDVDIDVEYLTRVEGHGNIEVNARNGEIEKCEWQVVEAPRFFESLVVGRDWTELHHVTSRICGICSIGHTLTSLKATEDAMDIDVSEQDKKLRKLALHGENMQSHVLHVGYLALPDLMDSKSVVPLTETHEEEVKTVIRLHRLANEMSDIITGRTTHPQRLIPGGFSKIPTEKELMDLKNKLEGSFNDLTAVANLLNDLDSKIPAFERETEYISLTHEDEFALYGGDICSSDIGTTPAEKYLEITNEYTVPQSTAKYTKNNRESYMVGALARLNNNYGQLSPMAKDIADKFDFDPLVCNPFMNTIAQVVEVVHSVEDSIRLIEELLDEGLEEQGEYNSPDIEPKAGRGVGAVEVPRGILFHDYTYDEDGKCTEANCVIPTNQNHGNIQLDMEKMVPDIISKPEEEVEKQLSMLVRAYDPCISCSTHDLNIKFVD